MAALFNFLFCSILLYSASYCFSILPVEIQVFPGHGSRVAIPSLLSICENARQVATSRKIFCFICKGFDPSCFHGTTTTTAAPSTTTTTAAVTTTSAATTTPPTTKPEVPATAPTIKPEVPITAPTTTKADEK